jgi:hypothetical protein
MTRSTRTGLHLTGAALALAIAAPALAQTPPAAATPGAT